MLVESHLGRPTKIEGNDQHPASLGGTDIFAQASILGLYDPDRSQSVISMGDQRSWQSFLSAIRGPLSAQKALQGAGIRILTPTISSPTLADQLRNFLKIYPQAKWHVYEPVNRDNVLEGAKLAFGQPVETRYDFSKADVIVSLDADFLYAGFPGNVRYIRDFANRRNPDAQHEPAVRDREHADVRRERRRIIGCRCGQRRSRSLPRSCALCGRKSAGMRLEAEGDAIPMLDCRRICAQHQGSSVVIVGDHQPPAVHALAHAINAKLGNVGKTVFYTDPVDANPVNQTESIKDLVADMRGGKVDLLVILGGNPVYDAPADLNFADALTSSKVPLRVHLRPLSERNCRALPVARQRKRTNSKPGAMPAPTTARSASFSR